MGFHLAIANSGTNGQLEVSEFQLAGSEAGTDQEMVLTGYSHFQLGLVQFGVNSSDCGLEWESIAIMLKQRLVFAKFGEV